MKKILLLACIFACVVNCFAQSPTTAKLQYDTVKIGGSRFPSGSYKGEVFLLNSTKDSTGTFAYNVGGGRVQFKRALIKVNDSIYLVGPDTLKIKSSAQVAGSTTQIQFNLSNKLAADSRFKFDTVRALLEIGKNNTYDAFINSQVRYFLIMGENNMTGFFFNRGMILGDGNTSNSAAGGGSMIIGNGNKSNNGGEKGIWGDSNNVWNPYGYVFGHHHQGVGGGAIAVGQYDTASTFVGGGVNMIGYHLTGSGLWSTVIGQYNDISGYTVTGSLYPMFQIGIGTGFPSTVRKNAFTVLSDGSIIFNQIKNNISGDSVLYVDNNGNVKQKIVSAVALAAGSQGQIQINGNGPLAAQSNFTITPNAILNIGSNTAAGGSGFGLTIGTTNVARSNYVIEMGNNNQNFLNFNTILGESNTAGANAGYVLINGLTNNVGSINTALYSIASGDNINAYGTGSATFGHGLTNNSNGLMIGRNNDTTAFPNSTVNSASSSAFVIGNGASSVSRSNAFAITNDGTMYAYKYLNNVGGDSVLTTDATGKVVLKLFTAAGPESDPTVPSYVKSIASGDITNWNNKIGTSDNFLTTTSTNVRLGGTGVVNTTLDLNTFTLAQTASTAGGAARWVLSLTKTSDYTSYITSHYDSLSLGIKSSGNLKGFDILKGINGIVVNDAINTLGMIYPNDYSTNGYSNPRWIPDIANVRKVVHDSIATVAAGSVSSVALTVPSAFSVSGSPITSSGTLAITGAGTTSQYIRGDGTLATTDTTMIPNFATKVRNDVSASSPLIFTSAIGVFSIQVATSGQNGYLSSTDWSTFNNKVSISRQVLTSAPLSGGGDLSTNRTISISQATTSTDGYISSTDWNTFNNKQSTLVFTNGLTNTSGTVTDNLITGISGGQTIIGSTSTNSGLTVKATSGVGASGADIVFVGGNNGATEFARFLNAGLFGIRNASPTAFLDIAASTTSNASLRLRNGVAPTAPNNGDVWYDGTHLMIRIGGTSFQLDQQPGSGTVTSVAVTVPSGLSVGGSPITTSGTIAITTALNGLVIGNGSGFSTATIGSNLNYTSGTLKVVDNPSFSGALTLSTKSFYSGSQTFVMTGADDLAIPTWKAVYDLFNTGDTILADLPLTVKVGVGGQHDTIHIKTDTAVYKPSDIASLISAGTGISITGSGTPGSPYVINSSGGSGTLTSINSQTGPAITLATGTSGTDFAVAAASNTITFNLPAASSTNSGKVTTGAQTFNGVKTLNASVTAASGTAKGFLNSTSLTAAANNDILYGEWVSPTFTDGAFTNITHYAAGFNESIYVNDHVVIDGPANGLYLLDRTLDGRVALFFRNNHIFNIGGQNAGFTFVNPVQISLYAPDQSVYLDDNGRLSIGNGSSPTSMLDIKASSTTASSLRVRSGVAPTSPNSGDMWFDGTHLQFRIGTTTFQLDQQSGGGGGSGTVTSVALTMPSGFSVGGSPITTSGTLAVTTSINGFVYANGSGFAAGTISSGLTNTSGTLTNDVLTGKSGGQIWNGGTAASDNVTIASTTSGTKGNIFFGSGQISFYNEANNYMKVVTNSLGGVQSNTSGMWITNNTAAANNNQQISGSLTMEGQGWKTNATAASQSVKFEQHVTPVQNAANPTGYWGLSSSVNGGSYANTLAYTTDGNLGIGTTFPQYKFDVQKNDGTTNFIGRFQDFNTTGYTMFSLWNDDASAKWNFGTAGHLETFFGISKDFFVFDQVNNQVNFLIDQSRRAGFGGVTSPVGYIDIAASTSTIPSIMFEAGTDVTSGLSNGMMWVASNNLKIRLNGVTNILNKTFNAPLSESSGAVSISQATTSTNGYLSSTDWNTFNNKQSTLTFSTGLTNTSGTITDNLATGVSGGQTVTGSTSTNSGLSIKSTTGVGASGADIIFKVGNNGATEAMRILNNANVGIGTNAPATNLHVVGGVQFDLGSDASYDLYYRGTGGTLVRLPNTVTSGYVLTGTTGAAPSWANPNTVATSGTYTPTITNGLNVTSTSVTGTFKYYRVGNLVHIAGWVNVSPTSANVNTTFQFTLPSGLTTTFSLTSDMIGTVTTWRSGLSSSNSGFVQGNTSSNNAQVGYRGLNTTVGGDDVYIEADYVLVAG